MSENKKLDKITAVKGMNDILPADAPLWELFENTAQSVLQSYGFQQIRTPIVEETKLFARANRRRDRYRGKGNVFVHRFHERRQPDPAPRGHGRRGARRGRAQSRLRRPETPVVQGPDVPPRASAERPLPPVPSVRRGSHRLHGPGHRRRDHHAVAPTVG